MFEDKRIMIVAAHPDDEILGLGATMHNLISLKKVITHVVILGEGITSRSMDRDLKKWEKSLEIHKQNIETAQSHIGYHSLSTYNFADNRFDNYDLLDIVKVIEKEKEQFIPDIIFTHHGNDLNIDHQYTFQAVMTATRPMENECTHAIITFETPSCTEWQAINDPFKFSPNLFFSVDEKDIYSKTKAMESYDFEKRVFPHPRSPEALKILAQNRGIQIGKKYAEAFQIIRMVI